MVWNKIKSFGKDFVKGVSDVFDGAVDFVVDIVESTIGFLTPEIDIPDFSQNQADQNARGVLVNITGKSPTLGDQTEVTNIVEEIVSEDANIIYGLVFDDSYKDDLKVTIVATGVDQRAPALVIDNEPTMTLNPVGLNRNQTNQEVDDFVGNFTLYLGLDELSRLFEDHLYLMLFWTHFIAINLFIGGWIVKDSQKYYINKILVSIPLIITYLIGPIGLFFYWIIRIFYAKRMSLYE